MNRKLIINTFSAASLLAGVIWIESRYPLRKSVESKRHRWLRNVAITASGALVLRCLEVPIVGSLSKRVEKGRLGILNQIILPKPLYLITAVTLMDYTLYLWHVLAHKLPVLWRFHQVHHADLDMDATTANRFHFGELSISILWRALQVCVIGINPMALRIWQSLLTLSILFHHSNIKLPGSLDKILSWVLVTPRMHDVHHSVVVKQTNSNFSSGFSIWDRLHRTYIPESDQATIIGIPSRRTVEQVSLVQMLAMPFKPLDLVQR